MTRIPSDRIRQDDREANPARSLATILKNTSRGADTREPKRPLAGVLKRDKAPVNSSPVTISDRLESKPSGPRRKEVYTAAEVGRLRDKWRTEWSENAAVERRAAEHAAHERGRSDAQTELEEARRQFEDAASHFNALWRGYLERVQPQIADLAFSLASGILAGPLPDDMRSISVNRLAVAVEKMGTRAPIEISVHPVELMRLQESGVSGQLSEAHPGLRWNSDSSLETGDWEARCPSSVIRHVAKEMLDDLKDRLQIPDSLEPPSDPSGDATP